ncbi:uncharacterized protein J3D65DRAFT_641254 [Phyllosticta citribraziliensis]|uniref:C3H1-type domain-containing protein n=1 Tax=Phyllosticta citribraziliensis TaxID=989973 RepID=A0ABR1L598_9PEZI
MTVCRYFQQGNCRFGERCKFEHPGQVTQGRAPQQTQNRYGALNNQFGGGAARAPPRNVPNNKYNLDQEVIRIDLSTERPIWPFSAYGPAKAVPRQLIEGAIEQSPEEMRFRFYALGNPQQAAAEETALLEQSNQQVQSILNDLPGAIKFVLDGDNMHPNRNDICDQTSSQTSNTFSRGGSAASGRPIPTGPAAFGANKPSGFGQPSFGAPAGGQQQQQQQQSAFGRPSSFSQPNQGGAFGAPSSLGANSSAAGGAFGKPAFGQPANPGQNHPQTQPAAFGQPSQPGAFGQPAGGAFGKPAFGQAFQPGGGAFGQPSQPGGAAAFGQPSQPGGAAAFGQPSQPGSAAFGQPSQPGGGVFGKPAATPGFGQPAFGQPAAPQNSGGFPPAQPTGGAFGNPQAQQQQQQQQPTPSPFGQPAQAQPSNPFQQQQQQQQQPTTTGGGGGGLNAFGQPAATNNSTTQQQQPNGTTTTSSSLHASAAVHPATHDPATNRLITWKGQRVEYPAPNVPCYRDPADRSGALIRIWHPTPPAEANPFHEGPPAAYEGDAGRELAEAYAFVRETGMWRDGVVPEVPPKGEWVGWDV